MSRRKIERCRWPDCDRPSDIPLTDARGYEWSYLCGEHLMVYNNTMNSVEARVNHDLPLLAIANALGGNGGTRAIVEFFRGKS